MKEALEGIKILDLTRLLPYQFTTFLLADMGAEVLKIEDPQKGDYSRWLFNILKEESAHFLMCNRNKKSMKLNLKTEKGKEILKELAKGADVFFESFRPGVMDRLGLGYEVMRQVNPRLIYCSGTGYGQTGPMKDRPGHDINYIGVGGILGATGRHTGSPVIPGIPIADMAGGGVYCALGILLALMARERTGAGQHVDVSMTDCMASIAVLPVSNILAKKKDEKAKTLLISGVCLAYNVYPTKDGKFVASGNVEDKFWVNFCKALGREDLIGYQFVTGEEYQKKKTELDATFKSKTQKEWLDLMEKWDVCFGPVNEPEDILEDPQLMSREMFFYMEHPVEGKTLQLGYPIKFSLTPPRAKTPPPAFGQHTIEVLKGLGFNSQQIDSLRKEGVI